jgi:hypothetical protein
MKPTRSLSFIDIIVMVPVLYRPSLALHQLPASFGSGFHPVEALSRFIPHATAGWVDRDPLRPHLSLYPDGHLFSFRSPAPPNGLAEPGTGRGGEMSGARTAPFGRSRTRCRARSESRTPSGIAKVPSGGMIGQVGSGRALDGFGRARRENGGSHRIDRERASSCCPPDTALHSPLPPVRPHRIHERGRVDRDHDRRPTHARTDCCIEVF